MKKSDVVLPEAALVYRDHFDERAAIIEFCAGTRREEAEALAKPEAILALTRWKERKSARRQ